MELSTKLRLSLANIQVIGIMIGKGASANLTSFQRSSAVPRERYAKTGIETIIVPFAAQSIMNSDLILKFRFIENLAHFMAGIL